MTQKPTPINRTSADLTAERLAQLRDLFPEAFTEGKVDFAKLRAALGEAVDDRPERYQFTWAGKSEAIRLLQTPTGATLLPAPDESVNWDSTANLFIEGDNLEVLKLLYKSYFGRVKLIYIDPPYNTGNDFIYPDNFAAPLDTYLELTGQKDAEGNILSSNTDTSGRYHSTWLTMIYPRLFLARQLLREDGVIFVSIDDNELPNLRLVMNEVFGEENFVTQVEWQKRYTRSNNTDGFTSMIEHILVYQKSLEFQPNLLERDAQADARYSNPDNDPRGSWKAIPFLNPLSPEERPNLVYEIVNPTTGERIMPTKKAWRSSKSVFEKYLKENRIWWGQDGRSNMPSVKRFLSEVRQGMTPINFWDYKFAGHTDIANAEIKNVFDDKVFDTPKPVSLICRMLEIATAGTEDDIVLDFFAGSCSTAHAVLSQNRKDQGNRRFIMVQLPEPISSQLPAYKAGFRIVSDIGKERIRRVIAKMQAEDAGKLDLSTRDGPEDLGFKVFKLAPSHLKPWAGAAEAEPEAFANQLQLFTDPLQDGWTPAGVIYEIALKEGYALTSWVEGGAVAGHEVFKVTDPNKAQHFHICLDSKVSPEVVAALGLGPGDLFICRDAALDDTTAANLALQCRLKII